MDKTLVMFISLVVCLGLSDQIIAQNTKIRGFIDLGAKIDADKLSFNFGEQDLFITSEINDNISFLGETVFKYVEESSTKFNVSVERVIVKYNYKGNHSLLFGKHHTPINYWNDTYHHGRVFFPTIDRPLLFAAHIIPIHTTGISLEGQNLGKLKFGYSVMVGNGIGSKDIEDNDKYKSLTAALRIKPAENLQFGLAYYHDIISKGTPVHDSHFIAEENIRQQLLTGTIAHFGRKVEVLAEGTLTTSKADVLGKTNAFIAYVYAGLKVKEKWIPYVRLDMLRYEDTEFYFDNDDSTSYVAGLRYEINYLAVVKLEYQHSDTDLLGHKNTLSTQLAIGF